MADGSPLRVDRPGGAARDLSLPGNAAIDWELFDTKDYFDHNYSTLRDDDRQIIEMVTDFFASECPQLHRARAIDVGTGANLYPALAMLPFAAEVTLYERAASNSKWLREELRSPSASWQSFWDAMATGPPAYRTVARPFEVLHHRTAVVEGNISDLEPASYDLGTMFFVAESITPSVSEFVKATTAFVESLRHRALFGAAFMRDSSGYEVGGRRFPSCSVEEDDVTACLLPIAHDLSVRVVESKDLREGYDGMIVATGRAGRRREAP
ncbi:SCO2525 family SAM-dependent methyltransferase [Actinoplanes sp. NPDC049118]|uniref:SCO2525 family SAM-dependent methyltransferase n=1 Tax=Actinoplanes sp. NPDC049118 TaxID=3155769 RepID=UPI0034008E2C